jgi:uncharacterized protein
MLRSFRLANHRSFLEEQELLLIPSVPGQDHEVLTVAAIYGANASGKSNLLDGLRFMSNAVLDSFRRWSADGGVPRHPFRLTPEGRNRPSSFVLEAIIQDVPYTYGFTLDDETILAEWLYSYPEKRRRVLFEREGVNLKFGTTVGQLKSKLDVLEELTRPNALFLSLAAQSNVELLAPVYRWFVHDLRFATTSSASLTFGLRQIARSLIEREERASTFLGLLAAADLGITDLYAEQASDPHVVRRIGRLTERLNNVDQLDREEVENIESEIQRLQKGRTVPELRFVHSEAGEPFTIYDESDGTLKWLALLPSVMGVLERGCVLVIDEIDSSLHPLLTVQLLQLFMSPETNPKQAQLIFTTHDTTPLGSYIGRDVLQRDQVWFVEKDRAGKSKLYPLTDFKPRIGENTEKRYLGGSYGAVPVLNHVGIDRSDVSQ